MKAKLFLSNNNPLDILAFFIIALGVLTIIVVNT
jgi:hypothetical protein